VIVIDQVSVFLENTSGRLAEMTRVLGNAGVNMRALMIADTAEFGVVRVIADRPNEPVRVLQDAGFGASLTKVIAVQIPDRPGGLADVLEALGQQGLNVEYAYCFVEPSGGEAVDIFKIDAEGAADALRSAGFTVLEPSSLYEVD
jgi:hypothetical protein